MYENSCNIQKSFTVKNSFSSFPVVVTLVFPLEKLMSAFLMFPEGVQENLHLDFHSSGGKYTLSYNPWYFSLNNESEGCSQYKESCFTTFDDCFVSHFIYLFIFHFLFFPFIFLSWRLITLQNRKREKETQMCPILMIHILLIKIF